MAIPARRDTSVFRQQDGHWRQLVGKAAAIVTAPGPFIVDVTGLDFMGCCAFAVPADDARLCRDRGVELRLVGHESVATRIVDACGLSGVLTTYPTVDSALASAARTGALTARHARSSQ